MREKYTTPRSQAQDRRRTDWTAEQQMSLALAFQCTGKQLGATRPKVSSEQLETAKEIIQNVNSKNIAQFPKKPPQNNNKEDTTTKTHGPTQGPSIQLTEEPNPSQPPIVHQIQDDTDPETQELVQQILQCHETKTDKPTTAPTKEDQSNTTVKINLIRLCLCTDPSCPARNGQRTTNTNIQPPVQTPQIAQTRLKDDTVIKTVQIQFEEWTPFIWQHAAAYINCHSAGVSVKALLDTGSCISIISYDKAKEISSRPLWTTSGGTWDTSIDIKAYSCTNTLLNLKGRIYLPQFDFGGKKVAPKGASFWVLDEASEQCIISGEWLIKMKAVMSMQQKVLYYSWPQETLSAGAEHFVTGTNKHNIENKNTLEIPEIPEETESPTILKVFNHLRKVNPTIPANAHYSSTIGPIQPEDRLPMIVLTNSLPAKISARQSKLMISITNTTTSAMNLGNNPTIEVINPNTYKVQNTEVKEPPNHLKLDDNEYEKTSNHVEAWNREQREQEHIVERNPRAKDTMDPTSTMVENLEKLQAKFDFKEHMHDKNLPIDSTKITFTTYPEFGEKPFCDKTDTLTVFLCYILLAMGQTLNLQTLSKSELDHILQNFREKTIATVKSKIDQAFQNNNITKLYYRLPLQICYHLHLDFTQAFDNINRLQKSKKRLSTRQYHTIEPALLKRLVIKTQAWSTLLFYTQHLTNILAEAYGLHPYYYNKSVPRHQFSEIPIQLQGMPPQLLQQILQQTENPETHKIKVQSNRIKNKQEFKDFLFPSTPTYKDRNIEFRQFKAEALRNYDQLNQEAERQVRPPVPPRIYKTLSIEQLKTPEDVQDYVKYATSPSALHNFMKEQLPPSTDQVIPIGSFLKTLTRAKLVIYESPEQAIRDYIPTQLRPEFDQFFTMFRDKQFIKTSSELRLPDYPQMWVWNTPHQPSPLHDINTGLVLPKWLAFCATQMLSEDDIILQPEFETELALLASLMFVYGQFTISLHANHTGLFREDIFRAKSLLCPNTAVQNAKPPRNMGMTFCPDLSDKVEFMLKHGKTIRVHCSPWLTSMTSIAKKRKAGKPLQFPPDCPILQHLLEMSRPKQTQLSQQSLSITKARKELTDNLHQNKNNPEGSLKTKPRPGTQPRSCKVTTIEPIKRGKHYWTQSLAIEQIQQTYLTDTEQHRNKIWNPPFSDREKEEILEQIDQLSQTKLSNWRQKNKDRERKAITWGTAIVVRYDPADLPEPAHTSKYYPQYFQTPADHDLHQALNNHQQVANRSRHMVKPEDKQLKQNSDQTGYCVQFAFNKRANNKKLHSTIPPTASRKQGLLANAHIFNQLIEDTSNLALQAKIGPDHPQYDEIMKICITQVHAGQTPLIKVQAIMNHTQETASLNNFIQSTMAALGKHTIATRRVANHNINNTAPESWQQCQKALSLVLGSALLHSTENANILASIGPTLNRFIRGRKHLQAYKQKSKHQQIAQELIKGIWPERINEWNTITTQEAKKHFKTWEELFGKIALFYKYPLVVMEGAIIKKSQRSYFDILKVAVYRADQYDKEADVFGFMAGCLESNEIFSTKASSAEFIRSLIQHANKHKQESTKEYHKYTIKEVLRLHRDHQEKTDNQDANRYSKVHLQHLEMDVYWKRDPFRTIINTRYNNHLCRESNTSFQSQHEIRQSLANSQFFSSFDLSAFYDQILSCPTSSLINTVLYQGQELAMTTATMGSKNSHPGVSIHQC